jgi:hypothetical protein
MDIPSRLMQSGCTVVLASLDISAVEQKQLNNFRIANRATCHVQGSLASPSLRVHVSSIFDENPERPFSIQARQLGAGECPGTVE